MTRELPQRWIGTAAAASMALAAIGCRGPCTGPSCGPPPAPSCVGADHAELGVPYFGQSLSNLCWAAATRMVLSSFGRAATECQVVKARIPACPCDERGLVGIPDDCNQTEFPPLAELALGSRQRGGGLDAATVRSELSPSCGNRPFLFTWDYGDTAHIMLADGFTTSDQGDTWIWAMDPATVQVSTTVGAPVDNSQEFSLLRHDYFVAWPDHHKHAEDYYAIVPGE